MGCDIHPAIEFRESANSPWKAVKFKNPYFGKHGDTEEFTYGLPMDRDYDTFAILGNVRNGTAFAGCDTGDGFDPMSDNRGVPEDISEEAKQVLSDQHSATWVTLAEILAYDWERSAKHRGWVNAVEFEAWDRIKEWNPRPKSYCGGVSGGSVNHVSVQEMRTKVSSIVGTKRGKEFEDAIAILKQRYGSTYCLIEWETSYSHDGRQVWTNVLPKMLN